MSCSKVCINPQLIACMDHAFTAFHHIVAARPELALSWPLQSVKAYLCYCVQFKNLTITKTWCIVEHLKSFWHPESKKSPTVLASFTKHGFHKTKQHDWYAFACQMVRSMVRRGSRFRAACLAQDVKDSNSTCLTFPQKYAFWQCSNI